MVRGLLLGNGINACIGIEDLSIKDIGKRFLNNVKGYSIIIEGLFGVKINEAFLNISVISLWFVELKLLQVYCMNI